MATSVKDNKGKVVAITTAKKAQAQKPEKQASPAGNTEKKKEAPVEKKTADNSKPLIVTMNRSALLSNLKIAQGFVEKKATMPVLTHILFVSDGKDCTISATNLSVSWVKVIPCKGAKVSRCIPAEIFYKEVSAVSDSDIELTFTDAWVKVDGRCDILTMNGDEYPEIRPPKGKDITITHLVSALKKVLPSVGESDTRYTLNGVYVNTKSHEIVATDGHRLHFDKVKIEGSEVLPFIVPKQAAKLIEKYAAATPERREVKKSSTKLELKKGKHSYDLSVFGKKVTAKIDLDDTEYMDVAFSGAIHSTDFINLSSVKGLDFVDYLTEMAEYEFLRQNKPVTLKIDGADRASLHLYQGVMQLQLIQGTYPDYSKIVPKKNPIKVEFESADFLRVMAGALPVSRQTKAIRLTINGKMTIESVNPELGQYKWQIAAKSTGKAKGDYIIGFNADYLITAIKAYIGDHGKVTMALDAPLSPCLINDTVVIMPMRA